MIVYGVDKTFTSSWYCCIVDIYRSSDESNLLEKCIHFSSSHGMKDFVDMDAAHTFT